MRCEDIRDRFVELLYNEVGTPAASSELRGHIQSCPSCRQQMDELKQLQGTLREWKDELPLCPVALPETLSAKPVRESRLHFAFWTFARYAAVAACLVMAFLAGLTYQSSSKSSDFYTKAEIRELVRQALQDTEMRVNETTNLKLQKVLDTVENEQGYIYSRLTRFQSEPTRNKN
jgi:predicted anti-sigma-YlaC factor YlaD